MYAGSGVIGAPDPTITPQLAGRRTMYAVPVVVVVAIMVVVVLWLMVMMVTLKGGERWRLCCDPTIQSWTSLVLRGKQ
jgi:predicted ABC-type sugar transport system permease subunit